MGVLRSTDLEYSDFNMSIEQTQLWKTKYTLSLVCLLLLEESQARITTD